MERATAPTTTASRPAAGRELELTIDSLAFGGAGRGAPDGYVVFVAGRPCPATGCAPWSQNAKRAYAQARAVEILEPSPDRDRAACRAPGAPWQVLPYERQLEVKQAQVDDALRRIGRLDGFELEPIMPAR